MFSKIYSSRRKSAIVVLFCMVLILTSCSTKEIEKNSTEIETTVDTTPISVNFDDEDLESNWVETEAVKITFDGDSIITNGKDVIVDNNTATILSSGVYELSGNLNNGQIIVNAQDKQTVRLILNGVTINNNDSAPIYVKEASKTVITLAEGTDNTFTDGKEYVLASGTEEPNAAIFSKDDLTINGTGSLIVNGNYKDGIASKDELKIVSGKITVSAARDGIKGRDDIAINDGEISIEAKSDGMQSNNDEDESKGFVYIEGGKISIIAGADGIQGETKVLVKNGNIDMTTGGGSENTDSQSNLEKPNNLKSTNTEEIKSEKGIKAGVDITIEDGMITIDSSDDALHSNSSISIKGGSINITSGDDGIHSDTAMVLDGGEIIIEKSYEGIESNAIVINNGSYHITASDDGINTAGGNDGSATNGRPGQNNFDTDSDSNLYINGGYIFINAQGDGMDSNGAITMTDGTVLVNGPTNGGNGALDYNGICNINGGILIAVGSAGMAQGSSDSSAQNSILVNLDSTQSAGTLINIKEENGQDVFAFAPEKDYQSVVISSSKLKKGSVYFMYTGGTNSGVAIDGLYNEGTTIDGKQTAKLEIVESLTIFGTDSNNQLSPGNIRNKGDKPTNRKFQQNDDGYIPEDMPEDFNPESRFIEDDEIL